MSLFRTSKRRRKLSWKERLFRRYVHTYHAKYLLVDLQRVAKEETLAYILEEMRHCLLLDNRYDLLEYAVAQCEVDGLFVEFGVADGQSIREIAGNTDRTVHGFDSFEGLPEDWAGTRNLKGKFSRNGSLPKVPRNVELHAGWFDDTLPAFVAAHDGRIAFAHIDCDLYSSTKTVFAQIGDRLQPGSVLCFDEYFNYPNWKEHEFKAFQEFVSETSLGYEYLAYTVAGNQVALKVTGI